LSVFRGKERCVEKRNIERKGKERRGKGKGPRNA